MILSTHGVLASQIASFDADAVAFFNRVTTAGGSLSNTEKVAVNQLVLDLKANSLWTPMKAVYPMVGASAAACAQNLKSSSFTGSFTSGWTFASTGVTPNGTSAYMNTNFNSNNNQTYLNFSLSCYVRTSTMGTGYKHDMGNASSGYTILTCLESFTNERAQYCWDYTTNRGRAVISTSDASGMWGTSRTASATWVSFERNTAVSKTTTTTATALPNNNVFIGATNANGNPENFSFREIAFAHLSDGLTNTEFNNLYTAVQAFQTTLSRQV